MFVAVLVLSWLLFATWYLVRKGFFTLKVGPSYLSYEYDTVAAVRQLRARSSCLTLSFASWVMYFGRGCSTFFLVIKDKTGKPPWIFHEYNNIVTTQYGPHFSNTSTRTSLRTRTAPQQTSFISSAEKSM